MKILWLLAFIWGYALPALASMPVPSFTDRYDSDIKREVRLYWPDFPFWKAFKAQLIQESRLNPDAISPVGARGLAQFMPATWQEVSQQLGFGIVSPHIASYAIKAGAYYMASLRKRWRLIDDPDRHSFAQASYNAGAGNINRAKRKCQADTYPQMITCLPAITGNHAKETIGYVQQIERYWHLLEITK